MNNLINISNNDGILVVSSREIAQNFEKRHDHTLRAIENLISSDSTQNWGQYFIPSEYIDNSGKANKEYLLTRDGFSLLVMGFTGQKALEWKMKYIEAFNKMEEELKNPYKNLSPELKAIFAIDRKTQELEHRVEDIENRMTIDYGQQLELQEIAKSRAIKAMGGMLSSAYRNSSLRGKVFSAVWKDYKDYFDVNSYKNTARKDFERAKEYLRSWQAQGKLLREIEDCNNQMQMDKEAM